MIDFSSNNIYLDIDAQETTQYIDIFFEDNENFLDLTLSEEYFLDLDFNISTQGIDIFMDDDLFALDIEMRGGDEVRLPTYEGAYEVDPRKVEQVLETKDKSMEQDVIVHPIFYVETSNLGGGLTAIIGLE